MTCPVEHCKEMETTENNIDKLFDKVGKKVDKASIKWYITLFFGLILAMLTAAITMWADTRELTKDVPELSNEFKETKKTVTEHDKEIEKIKVQMDNINNNTTKMLEILEKQQRRTDDSIR